MKSKKASKIIKHQKAQPRALDQSFPFFVIHLHSHFNFMRQDLSKARLRNNNNKKKQELEAVLGGATLRGLFHSLVCRR